MKCCTNLVKYPNKIPHYTLCSMPDVQLMLTQQPFSLWWAAQLQRGLQLLPGQASEEEQDLQQEGLQHLLRVRKPSVEPAGSKNCCKRPARCHWWLPLGSLCESSHLDQMREHDLKPSKVFSWDACELWKLKPILISLVCCFSIYAFLFLAPLGALIVMMCYYISSRQAPTF